MDIIGHYCSNFGHFAFLDPLGGLGKMHDVHVGLIRKRLVDFLIVLIEFVSLGFTAEAGKIDRKSAISLHRGQFDPKFQVDGVATTSHFCTDS